LADGISSETTDRLFMGLGVIAEGMGLFKPIETIGKVSLFAWQVLYDVFRPPFEAAQIARQIAQAGSDSLPLVIASGFALGTVMTLHTRSTLVTFGAGAMIPTVQALAFFVEIFPSRRQPRRLRLRRVQLIRSRG
jgi:ABC-type transporter Mla maintaining outer membrane lipid asymmetry permease subunit MlaE